MCLSRRWISWSKCCKTKEKFHFGWRVAGRQNSKGNRRPDDWLGGLISGDGWRPRLSGVQAPAVRESAAGTRSPWPMADKPTPESPMPRWLSPVTRSNKARSNLSGFRSPFVFIAFPGPSSGPSPSPKWIVSAPILSQGVSSVWPNRQPLTAVPQPLLSFCPSAASSPPVRPASSSIRFASSATRRRARWASPWPPPRRKPVGRSISSPVRSPCLNRRA